MMKSLNLEENIARVVGLSDWIIYALTAQLSLSSSMYQHIALLCSICLLSGCWKIWTYGADVDSNSNGLDNLGDYQ